MRSSLATIVAGLLAASSVAAASDVHDLKKDTFADFIKENDLVLAECECPPNPIHSDATIPSIQ